MELQESNLERDSEGFIILKKKYSELYKKTNYLTPLNLIQNRIYEYDIRSANVSMLRASGKVSPEILDQLESLDKDSREKAVGKMIRQNRKFYKIISEGIRKAREMLFRENQIQDHEVLAIKNDAVFVIGRKLKYTEFGPIEFRVKGQYTLFQQINKTEFYYDRRHHRVDIKGVNDKILSEEDHQKGMLVFFDTVFNYVCTDRWNELREYLIQFVEDYKAKRLPKYYYRELNSDNVYRTIVELSGFSFNLIEIGDDNLDIINPIYNYTRFILPMIRQYI